MVELFDALHESEGGSLYEQVLAPWADAHPDEVAWLRAFADRPGDPIPPAADEDLGRL